jgi:hypothetical protein
MNNSSLMRWGGLASIGVGLCSLLYGVLYVLLVVPNKVDTATSLVPSGNPPVHQFAAGPERPVGAVHGDHDLPARVVGQ